MNSSNISVCAILPTYNRAGYIGECLDSLLAQTRPIDQLIVVNDGSTDETEAVLKSYGDKIVLINKPNGGKSSAINLAMQQCTSELVWIVDDDDIAMHDGLANLLKPFESNTSPAPDVVLGRMQTFHDKDGKRYFDPVQPLLRPDEPNPKIVILEKMITNLFAMLVRKSLYDRVGAYREDLIRSQDYEMALRLCRAGYVALVNEVIYQYRFHLGNRGSNADAFTGITVNRKGHNYSMIAFEQVRGTYSLSEFTPTFASSWDENLKQRASHVQRARTCMIRGYWEDVVEDLSKAATISPKALTAEEIHLLHITRPEGFSWETLIESSECLEKMQSVFRQSGNGRRLVRTALQPMGYLMIRQLVLKRGSMIPAKQIVNAVVGVMGKLEAASFFLGSTVSRTFEMLRIP